MPLDDKKINEADLGRVDSILIATRPGYSKKATIIFTNGKADPRWKNTKPDAFGATFPSMIKVDEGGRTCSGMCLIDLYALLGASRTPGWHGAPATLSPSSFRYQTVVAIVHELAHINQGWQIGKAFARDFFEEEISAASRAADYSAVDPDTPNDPYLQNIFESGARNFAARWSDANGADIHKGKYDFLLPMIVMRGIFSDVPNVYQNR